MGPPKGQACCHFLLLTLAASKHQGLRGSSKEPSMVKLKEFPLAG